MDDLLISALTTLGIHGIFIILYIRLLQKSDEMIKRYMDFLEATIKAQTVEIAKQNADNDKEQK